MEKHFLLEDDDFENQFENLKLNPSLFSHEAHLRLAWIHIQKYGVESAALNLCEQIKNFAASVDEPDKFNATVTVAAIKIIYHFTLKSNPENFVELMKNNPRLKYDFKSLLGTHYSQDIFVLPEAKNEFLKPDLVPFD